MLGRGRFGVGRCNPGVGRQVLQFFRGPVGVGRRYALAIPGGIVRPAAPLRRARLDAVLRRLLRVGLARGDVARPGAVGSDGDGEVRVANRRGQEAIDRPLRTRLLRLGVCQQFPGVRRRVVRPHLERQAAVEALDVPGRRGVAVAAQQQDLLRARATTSSACPARGDGGHFGLALLPRVRHHVEDPGIGQQMVQRVAAEQDDLLALRVVDQARVAPLRRLLWSLSCSQMLVAGV